jgi:[ribosomal protein S5]-alanine N-acetyltransferase
MTGSSRAFAPEIPDPLDRGSGLDWLRDFFTPAPPRLDISGKRVLVRPPRIDDWRAWSRLRAHFSRFLQPWEPSWTLDALSRSAYRRRLKQYAADWESDQGYNFLIFCRDEQPQLVGGIALNNLQRGVAESAVMGYWMGEHFAGRGYMREAVPLVLDFAFHRLGLHRIEAACLEENTRSRNLLTKAGFQYEGQARSLLKINGVWRDHLVFAILRDDQRGPCSTKAEM